VILTQGEIDRLDERRERSKDDQARILTEAVSDLSELLPHAQPKEGMLVATVHPVLGPSDVVDRIWPGTAGARTDPKRTSAGKGHYS
jgi:hypothetical protein